MEDSTLSGGMDCICGVYGCKNLGGNKIDCCWPGCCVKGISVKKLKVCKTQGCMIPTPSGTGALCGICKARRIFERGREKNHAERSTYTDAMMEMRVDGGALRNRKRID